MTGKADPMVATKSQQLQTKPYFEYPIGHPRRRPRWGVPMRFDIMQIMALHVDLWILDLLTMDKRWRVIEARDTRMTVDSLVVSREMLEAGDLRRSGLGEKGDGVHGVYLGELVWALIGQLLPKLVKKSPSNFLKTAAFAAGYGAKDSASIATARVLDCALDTKRLLGKRVLLPKRTRSEGLCNLEVRLIRGRGITHEWRRVNVHARLELRDPPDDVSVLQGQMGPVAAEAESALRIWTKCPWWDECFVLGPARFRDSALRIVLLWHTDPWLGQGFPFGEVTIPLSSLLVQDKAISDVIVGWFPLERLEERSSGRIKLSLRLNGQRHLSTH